MATGKFVGLGFRSRRSLLGRTAHRLVRPKSKILWALGRRLQGTDDRSRNNLRNAGGSVGTPFGLASLAGDAGQGISKASPLRGPYTGWMYTPAGYSCRPRP